MALINYTFYSQVLRTQTKVAVVIPTREVFPEGKKFRTLYILHGGSDDCTYYVRNTGIERFATEGKFAVVMPEVQNSFYSDMKHGPKYFTYISQELPALMEAVFPLSGKREDHFLVGNSMGSHGAMKWGLRCPEFFNAVAGMSGVGGADEMEIFKARFAAKENNTILNAFGRLEQYKNSENDLKFLAKKLVESGKSMPRYYSCCGTEDFTYDGVIKFQAYAKEIGFPLVYEEGPGAHTWDFWDQWLRRIIDWMGIKE